MPQAAVVTAHAGVGGSNGIAALVAVSNVRHLMSHPGAVSDTSR